MECWGFNPINWLSAYYKHDPSCVLRTVKERNQCPGTKNWSFLNLPSSEAGTRHSGHGNIRNTRPWLAQLAGTAEQGHSLYIYRRHLIHWLVVSATFSALEPNRHCGSSRGGCSWPSVQWSTYSLLLPSPPLPSPPLPSHLLSHQMSFSSLSSNSSSP